MPIGVGGAAPIGIGAEASAGTEIAFREFCGRAAGLVRARGLEDQIKIVSYYFTPGVYQGIRRGQILAAPTDSAVIQGRVAIDQAVRILEGKDYLKHVGPALYVIDESNIETFDRSSSLAPDDFRPTFSVE